MNAVPVDHGGQVYRAMRRESDGFPEVGRSARTLGVRIPQDIPVMLGGVVEPGTGGMSVVLHDALHLPKHRRPRSLGGEGRDPVFALATAALPASLALRADRPPHALVEPRMPCTLAAYEHALCNTRRSWRLTHV